MALETAPASTVKVSPQISSWLMRIADSVVAAIPQPAPSATAIAQCKLVGHRGCKDVANVKENTFAAFDYARDNGMHGIELDLRWTKDQQLVVAHDPDLERVHGINKAIAELDFAELRALCPAVPLFDEVLERYRGQLQFYIELKKDDWNNLTQQQETLLQALATLRPEQDYYIMSFDLQLLQALDKVPPSCKVAIMHSNPSDVKKLVATGAVGTVGGHYLLLTKKFQQHCQQHKVKMGVGFPASQNSLRRELKKGVVFAFVDNPQRAKHWL
jgi:glycerophosphoryl diester phosphodiesterase